MELTVAWSPQQQQSEMPHNQLYVAEQAISTDKPFVQANTIESSLAEIRASHIIPVFIKDNEPVISQMDFIEAMQQVAHEVYWGEQILQPNVRLSHPVKGRIPEAKDKPASQLQEHEKTLYYERMAFVIEIPSVYDDIDGNKLSLCVGGVKAHHLDNLYSKTGADQHFKVFVGFKNTVCTNLCIWTDGYMGDMKVKNIGQLKACVKTLLENYNAHYHVQQIQQLVNYHLTEQQFATLIGKCRMYHHLPNPAKNAIPALELVDTQISMVCKDYYRDDSFCRGVTGDINLWKLYNLFTGANKSTYIDSFLDRSLNAYQFVEQLRVGLTGGSTNWFLN